ncbi:hypothetical protein SBC1_06420 [Caballeronia sp. SBC1]|uniref:DUF2946 family protein n=1 Tax=Caballeronia sp. SBC1 TaxID=2705548 RepID=UPI00140AC5BB|nr:DUF2946 family protein [Caballeronia sp. SBC1]QIN60665.1 hypothetical protein SBC1_06420 [Caballeronia sp. SBC1]
MDEIVKQALAKWPNVPHCTGWLLLDRRGQWRMRDDATQAARLPGDIIRHDALLGFINRNYAADADGQWFFQNGPQRVYVELGYTPWIVRLSEMDVATDAATDAATDSATAGSLRLTDHAGGRFEPTAVWLDDEGGVLFSDSSDASSEAPRVAALHDHDLDLFSTHADLDDNGGVFHFSAGVDLTLQRIERADVPVKFGFVTSPAAKAAAS